MKRSDIAMIILIASVSVIGAYFITNALIGGKSEEGVKVKTAEKITPDVIMPDSQELSGVFNKNAINPTVRVSIGTDKKTSGTDNSAQSDASQTDTSTNTDAVVPPSGGTGTSSGDQTTN